MKINFLKIILISFLLSATSIAGMAQHLLKDPLWDHSNQGKDSVCNRIFESLLQKNVYHRNHMCSKTDFHAIGYLKNIDFYYVSYEESDEFSVEYITELFKIHARTDISSFDYTKTSLSVNEENKDHCTIWGKGKIDSFDDYLVFYNPDEVAVYKKNKTANQYDEVSMLSCAPHSDEKISYDKVKRQMVKTPGSKKTSKGITETYRIVDGKIIKML